MEPIILSVIIVSFNTKDLLERCLFSLYASGIAVPFEVIVVDNGSSDGTVEMLAERYKNVVLLMNDQNLWFAKANNQGLHLARGGYVLLLNSDAFLESGCVTRLIETLEGKPNAAAAGPKVLNMDGILQSKGRPLPSASETVYRLLGFETKIPFTRLKKALFPDQCWSSEETRRVGWIAGCCMLLRKQVMDQIGGLCEGFVFYGEEIEWCYRAASAGYEVWYVHDASVRHLGGGSSSNDTKRILRDEALQLNNCRVLTETTVGLARGVALSKLAIVIKAVTSFIYYPFNRSYALDKLRQSLWEIKVCKHLAAEATERLPIR